MAANPLRLHQEEVRRFLFRDGLVPICFPKRDVKLVYAGSFISLRIEDECGLMTLKDWSEAVRRVADYLKTNKIIEDWTPMRGGSNYHMEGCVATWTCL